MYFLIYLYMIIYGGYNNFIYNNSLIIILHDILHVLNVYFKIFTLY